jgi:hypothetical protein
MSRLGILFSQFCQGGTLVGRRRRVVVITVVDDVEGRDSVRKGIAVEYVAKESADRDPRPTPGDGNVSNGSWGIDGKDKEPAFEAME